MSAKRLHRVDAVFGTRVRELRGEQTQREFAEKQDVTTRTVQNWEGGYRPPEWRIREIARRCRVSAAWLLGHTAVLLLLVMLTYIACAFGLLTLADPAYLVDEFESLGDAIGMA
jgi:transcriptional regulator with XRE-family HTH domain